MAPRLDTTDQAIFGQELPEFLLAHYQAISLDAILANVSLQVEKALVEEKAMQGREPRIFRLLSKLDPDLYEKLKRECKSLLALLESPAINDQARQQIIPQIREIVRNRISHVSSEILLGEFLVHYYIDFFYDLSLALTEVPDNDLKKDVKKMERILLHLIELWGIIGEILHVLYAFIGQNIVKQSGNPKIRWAGVFATVMPQDCPDPSWEAICRADSLFDEQRNRELADILEVLQRHYQSIYARKARGEEAHLLRNSEILTPDQNKRFDAMESSRPSIQLYNEARKKREAKQEQWLNEFEHFLQLISQRLGIRVEAVPCIWNGVAQKTSRVLQIGAPYFLKESDTYVPLTEDEQRSILNNPALPPELRIFAHMNAGEYRKLIAELAGTHLLTHMPSADDQLKQEMAEQIASIVEARLAENILNHIHVALYMAAHFEKCVPVILAATKVMQDSLTALLEKDDVPSDRKLGELCNLYASMRSGFSNVEAQLKNLSLCMYSRFVEDAQNKGLLLESDVKDIRFFPGFILFRVRNQRITQFERFLIQEQKRLGLQSEIKALAASDLKNDSVGGDIMFRAVRGEPHIDFFVRCNIDDFQK